MKYLKHKVYGHLFNLFKAFHVDNNRISFIIDSRESFKGNLDYIKKEFEKRGDFEFSFFIRINFHCPVSKNWQHPNMFF